MLSREKEEGTVTVLAQKPRPALPLMQKLILDFLGCAVRQPPRAAGGLLRISECLIIWDPLAGWPLPTSLASPAAPASVTPYRDGAPAATPARCSQRHGALSSPCAFAQAALSAQPARPSTNRHLENCL